MKLNSTKAHSYYVVKARFKEHQFRPMYDIQGVRFNMGISSIGLKSSIFHQKWHDMAHFEENTPPFDTLS